MASNADGMNYAPQGKPNPVVAAGEFSFAAVHLDHGHIYGQCNGLIEAGASLKWVYDADPAKVAAFVEKFPDVQVAPSLETVLDDPEIKLVAAAAIPNLRGALGCRVMRSGKDYFTDKSPFTSIEQLEEAERVCAETKQKYMVYYSERLHVESSVFAGDLVKQGAIGRVIQVIGLGPHRLNAASRPAWFFDKAQYGGIITDIGSHQIEQFLYFTGASTATIMHAAVANYNNPAHPELEDFGQWTLVGDNGAIGYHRVDWFTPDGLSSWGDGRLFVLGTEGYIEVRKYVNISENNGGDHVFLVNGEKEQHFHVAGEVGFPYFGELIKDCIQRSENAMTQAHCFLAARLGLEAQAAAVRIETA